MQNSVISSVVGISSIEAVEIAVPAVDTQTTIIKVVVQVAIGLVTLFRLIFPKKGTKN